MREKILAELKKLGAELAELSSKEKLEQADIDRIADLQEQVKAEQSRLAAHDAAHGIESFLEEPERPPTESGASAHPNGDESEEWDEQRLYDYFKAVKRGDVQRAATVYGATGDPNTIIGEEGGFVIPEPEQREIDKKMFQASIFAERCNPVRISNGNKTKHPALVQNAMTEAGAFGGIQAYWAGEGDTITASQPKFDSIELELEKLTALVTPTSEILEDAVQFAGFIRETVPEAMAYKLDGAIFEGNGAGQPLGINHASNPALVTINKESPQDAATIVFQNVAKMFARIPAFLRLDDFAWYVNSDTFPTLSTLNIAVGTSGQLVYMPPGGASQAPYGTLFGRPVIPTPHNESVGTAGDIVLANMRQYKLATKGAMRFAQSMHVYFTTDKEAFRFIRRVDGKPAWVSAVSPKKGSASVSPFIRLQTRS